MNSFVALLDTTGDSASLIATLAQRLRLPASSSPSIRSLSRATFAAVSHTASDAAQLVLRHGPLLITGSLRIDDRATIVRTLGLTGAPGDLEIVAAAWMRWGAASAERLFGDFSVVVWDERMQTLSCLRDHFGVRPLYYARTPTGLVLSDAIESVLAHPELDAATLDATSVASYFAGGLVEDPRATIFAGIRRVPPRSLMRVDPDGSHSTHTYWTPSEGPPLANPIEAFESALTEAIRDRTREGRAVVFMSGGLDSTTLAALANETKPMTLTACTAVYRSRIPDEEESFAVEAARSIGIPIRLFPLDEFGPLSSIEAGLWRPDPGWLLGAAASQEFYSVAAGLAPVALNGHPADALLANEPLPTLEALLAERRLGSLGLALLHYTAARRRPPWFFLKWLFGAAPRPPNAAASLPEWAHPTLQDVIAGESDVTPEPGYRSNALHAIASPIWASYFEASHPVGTQSAIELTYPFCDLRVVMAGLALAPIPWRVDKYILRRILRGRISEAIRIRRKSPLPEDPWQQERVDSVYLAIRAAGTYIDETLLRRAVEREGRLHDAELRGVLFEHWLRELPHRVHSLRAMA